MKAPFPTHRLADYLRAHGHAAGGPIAAHELTGGQSNPTYRLEVDGRLYVLRRKPDGVLLPSAHAIEREYRVMRALADADVPVPRVHLLCEDPSIIGTPFFMMDYVEGRVFWD